MLTKEQKDKFSYFLEAVNQISHSAAPNSKEKFFDLGLVILEIKTKANFKDIEKFFPKGKLGMLDYDDGEYEAPFIEKMAELIKGGKWALINLQKEPGHELLNQLKRLSEGNKMQVLTFGGKEIYNIKLPPNSRIVVAVKRELLEKENFYPFFLNIFGPIISL